MKACTCFLLFRIFAYTSSSPLHTTREDKGSAELELDRVLQLNVDKNSKFNSDRKVIGDNKISRRDVTSLKLETFTDYLLEVIKILNTYDDNTLEDFFLILDKEIKKNHHRGYKYHELIENKKLRSLVEDTLNSIKGKSVSVIKADINEVAEKIKHKTYDKNVKKLLNYINSIYREDAREKFRKVVTDLKVFGNTNYKKNELVKVIRNGLWAIVFNHYTNLNAEEKEGLKKEIAVFLKRLTEIPSPSFKTNFIPHKPVVSELNTNILSLKKVITEIEKPKSLKKNDSTSTTVNIMAENKRPSILRPKPSDELSENKETILETTKEESNSQQLVLTFVSTDESSDKRENIEGNSRQISTDQSSDETIEGNSRQISTDQSSDETIEGYSGETFTSESSDATIQERSLELSQEQHRKLNAKPYETLYIEDFYKITEKPAIIYKSKLKSKLVEEMLKEESTDRLPNARPNPKWGQRHGTTTHPTYVIRKARPSRTSSRYFSDNDQNNLSGRDLRRSIAPPMPNEELSLEVFDRERRKREKALAESYNFVRNNSIQYGLKDYIKRRRHLNKKINELKTIYEENQRSRVNITPYKIKNIIHDNEAKDKIHKDKNKQKENNNIKESLLVSERQNNTYEYEVRAHTEKNENKVRDTQGGVKQSNLFDKNDQDLENNNESVKSDDKHALKLEKQKMVKRSETSKATKSQKSDIKYKYSTKAMITKLYNLKSVKIPVFIDILPSAKKKKNLTETTS